LLRTAVVETVASRKTSVAKCGKEAIEQSTTSAQTRLAVRGTRGELKLEKDLVSDLPSISLIQLQSLIILITEP
jgi:hypothetical protein